MSRAVVAYPPTRNFRNFTDFSRGNTILFIPRASEALFSLSASEIRILKKPQAGPILKNFSIKKSEFELLKRDSIIQLF